MTGKNVGKGRSENDRSLVTRHWTSELSGASATHAELFEQLKRAGTLRLRGQLDLWLMLRAATQPLSKLDFEYPPETVTVSIK
jgi:hypothetical protein